MAMITRGGVSLKEIDPYTMQSKKLNGRSDEHRWTLWRIQLAVELCQWIFGRKIKNINNYGRISRIYNM